MTFINVKSRIKTIKPSDPMFYIKGEIVTSCRAGFEIKKECPNTYKEVITECIQRGWLEPVAFMRDDEYMWETLKD